MIIAFTGAGISRDSGILTFQDKPEMRRKLMREYADRNPKDYRKALGEMVKMMEGKMPNDAHLALAYSGIQVITMNIDSLHEMAGTSPDRLLKIHGRLPTKEELPIADQLMGTPVLYGDDVPEYFEAMDMVEGLNKGDLFLIVGASDFTPIVEDLRNIAEKRGANIIEIQADAAIEVPRFLRRHQLI